MPTYILLSKLTPKGSYTMRSNPERLNAVNQELPTYGCKVLAQYAVLGTYDFVTLVEAPNNETIAKLSVDLGARGTINITTLPAIPIEDFTAQLTPKD